MNDLHAFRADVATALDGADIPTTDHLPSVIGGGAPGAVLLHGSPYLEFTDTQPMAGALEVAAHLEVLLLADPNTDNQAETVELDDLLMRAAAALMPWAPFEVRDPAIFISQNTNYLSVRIALTEMFTIERT